MYFRDRSPRGLALQGASYFGTIFILSALATAYCGDQDREDARTTTVCGPEAAAADEPAAASPPRWFRNGVQVVELSPDTPIPKSELVWVADGNDNVQSLELSGRGVDKPLLAAVSKLFLEELRISCRAFGDEELRRLREMNTLRSLYLYNTPITGSGFDALSELTRLEKLEMIDCPLTDDGIQALAGLKHLTELSLEKSPITDRGMGALKSLNRLEKLNLSGTKVTADGLRQLSGLTNLTELNVPRMDGDAFAQAVQGCISLEDFSGAYEFSDAGLQHLVSFKNIGFLWLRDRRMTAHGIAELKNLPRLTRLVFDDTELSPQSFAAIAQIKSLQDLRLLDVTANELDLEPLADIPALETLMLQNVPVTGVGLRIISRIKSLQHLNLPKSKLTDDDVKHLLPLHNLASLHIGDALISDAGLKVIAQLTNLQDLTISNAEVTEDGLKSLLALQRLRRIWAPLTDAAIRILLKELPMLDRVNYTARGCP